MCVWVRDETTLGWPWLREREGWSEGEKRRVKEDMWLGRHPPPFLGRQSRAQGSANTIGAASAD